MIDFNDYISGLESYQKSCEELLEYYSQPEHYYETALTVTGAAGGLITPTIVGLLATKAAGKILPSCIAQQLGAYAGAFAIPIAHTYVYGAGVTEYSQAAISKTVAHSLYGSAAKSAHYNKMQTQLPRLVTEINNEIQPAINTATNTLAGLATQREQTNIKIETRSILSEIIAINAIQNDAAHINEQWNAVMVQVDASALDDGNKAALKAILEPLRIAPGNVNNINLPEKLYGLNAKLDEIRARVDYDILNQDQRAIEQIKEDVAQIENATQQAQADLETEQAKLQTTQEETAKIQALRPGWISASWSKTLWTLNAGAFTYFTYIKAKQGVDLLTPIGKYLDQRSANDANFDLSTFLTESIETLPETLSAYALSAGLDIPTAWASVKPIMKSTAEVVGGPVYEDYNIQWITPAIIAYKQTCTSIAHKLRAAADALMPSETQEQSPIKTEL